ncbi:Ser-Thr-rich glycosyl-phosphatidyl-inositol-anchored membrane family [Legionella lansingensis]|uniref:Ser-Thr-rich glycosyl-phosphatidyl-inositol-anchored membrane family protein n=1 Tax=Legionella lansingensis TaxID=45067 RepID=A0A0W0VZL1_9GAMM|nr:zinc-dependent metalloprotease family protein [Legionella lansingensis]KTD25457.1 Ser-Thr-rich glycosyl-phosphatidyl-inositol-anchored membrane family protein [Legionella lansingensis]SNV51485.1 Ser-Thr-rich glycosyl-phosphatidyl-inositol-anchored membrane family [Legionella lansingensis]
MTRMFVAVFLLLFSLFLFAQPVIQVVKDVDPALISFAKPFIQAKRYRIVEIDINQLYAELEHVPHRDNPSIGAPLLLELPHPDGTMPRYKVLANSTMDPKLAAQFPEIKTYDAYGLGNAGELVKLDITPHGFHAMIMVPGKHTIFIDPLERNNTQYYMVYYQKDFITSKKMKCGVSGQSQPLKDFSQFKHFVNFASCELRKYRLAMAATAQYTEFHGGTKPLALAAQVTTMNRVNGIFERDIAITMQLIANNTDIIYTDPNTQPYTHGDPKSLIEENQTNIDMVIGSANYDIGHVVDADGSGLASLGSVCDADEKAKGTTGQPMPVGDPFDVDYVAHEMGHQFGANHVQNNNCERNDPTAVEPGSGSTIMGYAGICAPNVQANTDAYFNGISLQEMGNFISSPGHTCPVKTPILPAPTITGTNGFTYIPASTPFSLIASATNPSGKVLTYAWEQMNNEVSQQPPVSTAVGGPNFRSFFPSVFSIRFFPNLIALANKGPFTWEVLPSVSRILKFRVSVRANNPGGACNAFTDVTVTTISGSGPFLVSYPTAGGITWPAGTSQSVTWIVANTNLPPVSATIVDILLSIDGGNTYPYILLQGAPNVGVANVTVPSFATSMARIMVRSSKATFFNVSSNNFTITTQLYLLQADRNPMNKREAFITYRSLDKQFVTNYVLNGLPNATLVLDEANQRFIVKNITTPRAVSVSITVVRQGGGVSETSNVITIPSIL